MNMNMNMSMSMKEYESVKETPSHIIPDGSHVYLPPPSALEKASFFAQSVANYKLIHADESQQQQKQKQPQQSKEQESNLGGKELDGQDNDNDNDNDNEVNNIHPLALASARLQTNGISELSKAINLSSLVHSNEYFAFSNIIDPSLASNNTQKTDGAVQAPATNIGIENAQHGHTNPASVTDKNASAAFALDDDFNHNMNENENEPILRSKFILKRKRQQFQSSTFTLRQHYKRLKVVTAAQKVLDQRYLQLRKRWKLSAPEHGSVVQAPVRPNETVAIDVDIYNQRQGQGQGQNEDNSRSGMMNSNAMEGNGEGVMVSTLGKITRMVPRYATIELAEHFDVSDLLKVMKGDGGGDQGNNANENGNATENKIGNANTPENATENENVTENANENNPDAGAASTKKSGPSDMDVDADADAEPIAISDTCDNDICIKETTEAKPFMVADPTLGSIDLERFDPDNVPMLTLYFQIEKSSTGFVHSVALSSVIQIDHDENSESESKDDGITKEKDEVQHIISTIIRDKVRPNSDEKVIQSLQHSLFCANVFDSIRKEVAFNRNANANSIAKMKSSRTGSAGGPGNGIVPQQQQQQQQQPVWLSSEMEDNFLPPPSLMAGGDMSQKGGGFDIAALSVIHCHEGEVKVQLNSEYALTVKLVDSKNSRETESASTNATNTANASASHSGSQTKEEIHVLCRLLLLHAQFVFHDHHKRSAKRDRDAEDDMSESKKVDYSVGILQSATNFRRSILTRKKMVEESPSILQSCVALGGKVLFERQVRLVLEVRVSKRCGAF